MSGIVGIVNGDGMPVDCHLLKQMTEFMSYRGPDFQQIWVDGNVGFGHALLATTKESVGEKQPFTLDGEVWITADARIDGRGELIEKLKGDYDLKMVTDVELILRAYHVWGEDCVEHLLGDFAFGIWDERKKRLFCARDHFGVKPFYYAEVGNCLIFSNTLNCVRIHPGVSDELNDLAIGDFLLFGCQQEFDTTAFAEIKRLPPAHCLIWSGEGIKIKRYWTLPIDGFIRYKRAEDYVENFQELMATAVGDRLRTNLVGVFMSGGMDSSSVAAVAQEVLLKKFESFDLRAYTVVYDRLIPDRERYYSGLVAQKLDIPIEYLVADDYKLFQRWDEPEVHQPEPIGNPLLAIGVDQLKLVANNNRVALNGYGGDPVLYSSNSYFFDLLKKLQVGELVTAVGQYFLSNRRLPPVGLRTNLKRWFGLWHPWQPPYPKWLNADFGKRLNLPTRLEQLSREKAPIHPTRAEAYQDLISSTWPYLFESYDPGVTGFPVEVRYPFFDLRLVNYLLAMPPIPWFIHKELMRVAMKGILPESVRLRPKTVLAGNPVYELLQQPNAPTLNKFDTTPILAKYVNLEAVLPNSVIVEDAYEVWINLRPQCLAYWLQNLQLVQSKSAKEKFYGIK